MNARVSPLSNPRLSVVVPTYQRCELLAKTIPTILDQKLPADSFEVVVVVDGSTDGTVQMLSERFSDDRLRVIERENSGPAVARNAGIEASRGELILLLDDDILCPPGLLAAHVAAHKEGEFQVVFGPVLGLEGSTTAAELVRWSLDSYYAKMRDEWHPDTSPTVYAAPNTSLSREALLRAGGFDVRFSHVHEDADLGQRLRELGMPFVYLPDAPVYQSYAKSAEELATREAERDGRGELLLCRTHPALRQQSFLRGISEGGPLRRAARAAVTRAPLSADWLLRPAFEIAEHFPRSWFRRTRLWLLSRRIHITRLRAASAEAGSWKNLSGEFGRRCPALLYHHVGPPRPGVPRTLTTPPARFEQQMRKLHQSGFTAITASRWKDWLRRGSPLPNKPIIVTFDDGYEDLAEHAFPVLRRYGFEATVFVVTRLIGRDNDWDAALNIPSMALLNAERLLDWSRNGIEFGAHGRTHVDLTTLSPARLEEEVAGSRADLENLLKRPVTSFAYPFGRFTDAVLECGRRNYDLGFSCMEGLNTLATDPHLLRRTMPQPSDLMLDFAMRAELGCSPLNDLRSRLRIRSRLRQMGRLFR